MDVKYLFLGFGVGLFLVVFCFFTPKHIEANDKTDVVCVGDEIIYTNDNPFAEEWFYKKTVLCVSNGYVKTSTYYRKNGKDFSVESSESVNSFLWEKGLFKRVQKKGGE